MANNLPTLEERGMENTMVIMRNMLNYGIMLDAWSIATALRGPDSTNGNVKEYFTVPVRWIDTGDNLADSLDNMIMDLDIRDLRNAVETLANPNESHLSIHYLNHIRYAWLAYQSYFCDREGRKRLAGLCGKIAEEIDTLNSWALRSKPHRRDQCAVRYYKLIEKLGVYLYGYKQLRGYANDMERGVV